MSFTSYELSLNVEDFHLAGFAHYDGIEVMDKLKPVSLQENPLRPPVEI